jgi:hypothetical protein
VGADAGLAFAHEGGDLGGEGVAFGVGDVVPLG